MRKKKVVVTDYTFRDLEHEKNCAQSCDADFAAHQCASDAEVIAALADADLAFVQLVKVPDEAVANMHEGAVIVRYGVGVDNLPLAACAANKVRVCNVPDYGIEAVADHTAAMLLCLQRKLFALDAQVRNGGWDAIELCATVPALSDVKLGVFGAGRIGREVLRRMQAFGIQALVHDPLVDDAQIRALGAEPVSADELWAQADMLTLHVPAVDATRGLICTDTIAKMKPGVIIVNCARGELIVEQDLAAALHSGAVGAAGLDVFAHEPLEDSSPLRSAPNVVLSSHAAWCTSSSMPRLQELAAEEGMRALRGEPLRCELSLT